LALAPPAGPASGNASEYITVKTAMSGHHNSPEKKVDVVGALLARSLAIVGNTGGTMAGLLLDRAEDRRFVIAARTVTIGPTIFANVAMLTEFGDIDRKPLQLVIAAQYGSTVCLAVRIRFRPCDVRFMYVAKQSARSALSCFGFPLRWTG
jgi:hypothetical protein